MIGAAALLLQAATPLPPPPPPLSSPESTVYMTARIFEGVWVDIFEGQGFVEGAKRAGDIGRGERPWLDIDRTRVLRDLVDRHAPGARLPDPHAPRLCRVRFLGREADGASCRQPSYTPCFGHMGGARRLIRVDKLLHIEALDKAPPVSSGNRR